MASFRGSTGRRWTIRIPVVQAACLAAVIAAGWPPRAIADELYQTPPKAIADLIDARMTPGVSLDPRRQWMLLLELPSLPPITELAEQELRLAGLRINPRTNGPSRVSHVRDLRLKRIADLAERPINGLPESPRIGGTDWSPDGATIAFMLTCDEGIELWTADVASGAARRLTQPLLNAAEGTPYEWTSDNQTLVCRFVVADRGPAPQPASAPSGPTVQETSGKKAPARTYQDLLKNAHDEALFDYYLTSRVAIVTLDGRVRPIGATGVIARADPSPDGRYLLVETIHRPYSYLVPISRFPRRVEIWDLQGRVVRTIADTPLAEEVPIGPDAVPTGPRSLHWRADVAATLCWTEAQDGGDPKREADVRDRLFMLPAPFTGEPITLVSLNLRFGGVDWANEELALVSEWRWSDRKLRTWMVNPAAPQAEPSVLFDRSFEDRYNDPGQPLTKPTPDGTNVLLTGDGGKTLYLSGAGASPEGDRPFLDRLLLDTKETQRLFRSEAPYYEFAVDLLDTEDLTLLTRRESKAEPPNFFVRSLRDNKARQITFFPHPSPQLKGVYKEQIRYRRGDGVPLTATLYLPPGKQPKDGPFPMLMWAYPQEFKSADAAGQVTDSPHRFVRTSPHSPLLWLVHGYAVLDDPSLPIVGEGEEEPNDTYVKQLVAGAQAAVDEVVRRGVANPRKIAVGGHSYGAFMAANLLAHSDLFRAGIARSGAYNRTLTPFGFQAEQRTFWEAPQVYSQMSPFMHADKVNEPILLIHGEADNNSGTFPLQSERFYNALKGLGATARLVMLPHESHGYRARESVMHVAAETTQWLDKYVKNADPEETPERE